MDNHLERRLGIGSFQHQRLAVREYLDVDLGRELVCGLLELVGRGTVVSGVPASQRENRVGPPVDRNRDAGMEQAERLRRAARVEVSRRKPRPPAGHRQQCGVEVAQLSIPSNRSVSPAKYTRLVPART